MGTGEDGLRELSDCVARSHALRPPTRRNARRHTRTSLPDTSRHCLELCLLEQSCNVQAEHRLPSMVRVSRMAQLCFYFHVRAMRDQLAADRVARLRAV